RHTRCYRDWSSDVCSSDLDILELPLAVLGVDARHLLALPEDRLRVDLDVGGLSLDALRERLVDEDLRVRQRHAHAGIAAGEEDGRAARCQAGAEGRHLWPDVLHRVV